MRECPECRNAIEDAARFCPYCGAASATATENVDPWIGQVVNGKFRVEALAGQGGMGRVYRARHLTLDRPVVLKMLHRDFSTDPQVVQRFQREARAASRLNHPNSIAVLDFGEAEDGTLFMAMEFLGGRDLAKVVSEEFPLGDPRIVRIGAQILSALAEAHAQGIIHRDLKPENVMVEPRRGEPDFVKVLDFGIAKITAPGANEPKLTQAGLVCGTPEYMSPEQARGADLDARTDLYSMGVILYQLATGELPFQSDTPVGFLTKHLSEVPVPARQRWADVSEALEAVISRAMEKDPARRYQTADEMREALLAVDPAAAGAPGPKGVSRPAMAAAPSTTAATRVTPAPATAAAAPVAPARRSRAVFWGFALAIAVAAAGGGAVTYVARQNVAAREGHPDTVSPAQAQAAAVPAAAIETPTPPALAVTPAGAAHPERSVAAGDAESKGTPAPTPSATPAAPEPAPAEPKARPKAASASAKKTPAAAPRRDPAKAARLYRKAEARRADQDIDGAIKLYLAAEASDPHLAEVQKKLALCYQLNGDTRRAAERYRRYLATAPPDAERVRAILSTLE
jgi:serine/threonine-protein kinase